MNETYSLWYTFGDNGDALDLRIVHQLDSRGEDGS